MQRAGKACYDAIVSEYNVINKTVSVLCGNGKNAGDGFVIARLLHIIGADVRIVLCDKAPEISEPLMYFEQAKNSGVKVVDYSPSVLNVDYIVDTMFGIGFHGEPRAPFDKVFADLKGTTATVISVDTPSGSNATDGSVCNNCVKADFTIAISALKFAHVLPPANAYCGKTVTVNIGIPEECYDDGYAETIEFNDIKSLFIKRDKNANKGTYGHQLNICGSYRMFGAAVLSASAALRCGVGLIKLTIPQSAYPLVASHLTQPVFNPVYETESGSLSSSAVAGIIKDLPWADSIVIGCGIGCNDDTVEVTEAVMKNAECPVIVDADGINCLKERISIIRDIKVPIVLTPHPGEMARLLSVQVAEIQENRIKIAKAFAKEYGVILVLKGANTVVTDGNRVFVNVTGNPGMAMGGSGDMLSGMLGAFVAQGINPFDAARAAVYIHGLCGDRAAEKFSQRGMLVSDMTEQLGALMSKFE